MKLRFTFMAPTGQNSWQQKHLMQFFLFITAFPPEMRTVFSGQTFAHFTQPTHSDYVTCGFDSVRRPAIL